MRARGRRGGTHQSAAVGTPREGLENGEEDALGEVVPSIEPLRGVARGLSAPTMRATGRPVAHRIVRLRRLRVRVGQTTALARERIAVLRGVAGGVRDDGARARVGTRHLGAAWSARGGAGESEVETCLSVHETFYPSAPETKDGYSLRRPPRAAPTPHPRASAFADGAGLSCRRSRAARSAPRARASARSPRGLTPLARSLRAGHPGHARRRRRPSASFPRLASTSPATPRSATRTARIWRRSARACAFARLCARS